MSANRLIDFKDVEAERVRVDLPSHTRYKILTYYEASMSVLPTPRSIMTIGTGTETRY